MNIKKNDSPKPIAKLLLGLQFLSDFGDQITNALLALCLLDITNSTGKVGLVYFISTVGYVVFTLAGGLLGDHLCKRKILLRADVGRGLAILFLILAVQQKSIVLIYLTSFILSILNSIQNPVKIGAWAESIPADKLERYNCLSEASTQSSTILGPLIASFFIVRDMVGWGFAIDAMTFFICAAIFAQIIPAKISHNLPLKQNTKPDFLKGFKLINRDPEIYRYVAYDALQMLGFGAFNATFLVLAQRDFGWSKIDYSYHLSIVAIFTTLGAIIGYTDFVRRINPTSKLVFCALGSAITLWAALKIPLFPISSIFVGICDGLSVLTMATTRTRVQLSAKNLYPTSIATIASARSIIIKAATMLGTGTCLLLDDFISLENTLTILVLPVALSILPFILKIELLTADGFQPNYLDKNH